MAMAAPPVAFVGKGICFDTGGHNLKSADAMIGMHEDMAGSAAVLGILLLPYAVRCSRAEVDHTELSSVLRLPEDGLQINLQSRPFGSDSD